MKVVHVITGMGTGGAEMMLLKTLPKLSGKHVVVSMTNDDAVGKELAKQGIKVLYLGMTALTIPLAALKLWNVLRYEKPAIVNSYLLHTNVLTRFVARLAGCKKVICSVRNIHTDARAINSLDQLTQGLVTVYTPNSAAVERFLVKELHLPREKMRVIWNGMDLRTKAKQDAVLKKELRIKGKVVLHVGKFMKQKAHTDLIRAMNTVPGEWTLLLAGDGPLREECEVLAKNLGIYQNVRFLGVRNDVVKLLALADCFAFPSLHEGMPNALLEAAVAEVPIVCSAIDENKDVIGKGAVYVPIRQPKALGKAIAGVLQNKPNAKVAQAKQSVQRFSIEKTVTDLEKLYGELL